MKTSERNKLVPGAILSHSNGKGIKRYLLVVEIAGSSIICVIGRLGLMGIIWSTKKISVLRKNIFRDYVLDEGDK
jgi:hypothetical protein